MKLIAYTADSTIGMNRRTNFQIWYGLNSPTSLKTKSKSSPSVFALNSTSCSVWLSHRDNSCVAIIALNISQPPTNFPKSIETIVEQTRKKQKCQTNLFCCQTVRSLAISNLNWGSTVSHWWHMYRRQWRSSSPVFQCAKRAHHTSPSYGTYISGASRILTRIRKMYAPIARARGEPLLSEQRVRTSHRHICKTVCVCDCDSGMYFFFISKTLLANVTTIALTTIQSNNNKIESFDANRIMPSEWIYFVFRYDNLCGPAAWCLLLLSSVLTGTTKLMGFYGIHGKDRIYDDLTNADK